MSVPVARKQQPAHRQLSLFGTRISLPRWNDLDHPVRMEIVTTLAKVLAGHVEHEREPDKRGADDE